MFALIRKLTVEQWRAIDAEYMDRSLPDRRVVWILLMIIVAMILPPYVGTAKFIWGIPAARAVFEQLPHPKLYPRLYWGAFKAVNYGLVPALCLRFLLREKLIEHGLQIRREGRVWLLYGAMALAVLPMTYAVSHTDAFLATYPKYKEAGDSLTQFFAWETAYAFQFFMLELFFRGVALFALARYLGSTAVFVMVVPYAMIHFNKPFPEAIGSVFAGIALGTIALRTRSIYGGVLVHCVVAWSMDIFALLQKGQLQRLF